MPRALAAGAPADAAAQLSTCVLLAADRTGYANLCRLITAGRLRRPKGESRVTWPEVCERAAGLVALWGGERSLLVRGAEPHAVAGLLREAFGDRLYALAGRHRRAEGRAPGGVPAPPRRARRSAAGRRHRGAVPRAGAPRPAGRPHLHTPWRHARYGRPVDQAERRARSEVAAENGAPFRRRAGAPRADPRGGGALHVQVVRDPLPLSRRAVARRQDVVPRGSASSRSAARASASATARPRPSGSR